MALKSSIRTPPRIYSELKPWLQDHYVTLPKRLQSVAVFALHNPEVIALSTIAVISEQAKVTDSTLVRFAKSIGYEGFRDMQSVFQESMKHISQPYTQRINQLENDKQSVLHRFSRAASSSIDKLEQQLDETAVLEASKLLSKARTIYIAGQGRTIPVITYLQYNFLKMGIQTEIIDGGADTVIEKAQLIKKDEALIASSFSPYTANTKEIVQICLERSVPIVTLTDSSLSPIAHANIIHLEVMEEEVGSIRGLSATMCLALCLAVETGKILSTQNDSQSEEPKS